MADDTPGHDARLLSSTDSAEPLSPRHPPPVLSARQNFPFHPFLIAAFPILSLYAHNKDEVPLQNIWRPLVFALLGVLIVWAPITLLTRHIRKAACAASALILVFFSYGHIANLLTERLRDFTAPLCLVGILTLFLVLYRSRGNLVSATGVVNAAAVALLLPSCMIIGMSLGGRAFGATASNPGLISNKHSATQENDTQPSSLPPIAPLTEAEAANLPDVYYIILDAYGRSDSLQNFYGYDNTPFLHALEERGFYVASHSRSNYSQTAYCLPSALNMNYLDTLLRDKEPITNRHETLRRLIDENAVAGYLRTRGYHYLYIWTGTVATRGEAADLILANDSTAPPSSFEGQLYSLTLLGSSPKTPQIGSAIAADYDHHRAYLLTAFHNLEVVPRLSYPKFVFAHILAPHPPFVFGPNGEAVHPHYPYDEADASQLLARISREDYKSGYIAQLRYINRRVIEAIDAIKRQSKKPPIIIVQGDHGSRMNLDWESKEKSDLREPFSNLNAYLVPPNVRKHLYDTITPVNSFRILLTEEFGQNYPPLPDRSFYCTASNPLHFSEVTDLIPAFPDPSPAQRKSK